MLRRLTGVDVTKVGNITNMSSKCCLSVCLSLPL